MSENEIRILLTLLPNILSIVSIIWFFYCYYGLPVKGYTQKSILVLAISDLIFHITFISYGLFSYLWAAILDIATRFSLLWACSMALLLYRTISEDDAPIPRRHFNISLGILIPLCCIFSMIQWFNENIQLGRIIFLAMPIQICLTSFFYLRSRSILKKHASLFPNTFEKTLKVLYQYAFVQYFTICPYLMLSFWDTYIRRTDEINIILFYLILFLVGLTGFANSFVYFFNRRENLNMPTTQEKSISRVSSIGPKSENRISMEVALRLN